MNSTIKNDIKSTLMLVQHKIYSFQDITTEGAHNIVPFFGGNICF